jgi:hypothetical protein
MPAPLFRTHLAATVPVTAVVDAIRAGAERERNGGGR